MRLIDSEGRALDLGPSLGKGGEGHIFPLISNPNELVKIYNSAASTQKNLKLRLMTEFDSSELSKFTCWPSRLVFEEGSKTVAGFIMPRALNSKEIHKLYSPKSRVNEFQDADWRFLISTAANVARSFAHIHSLGLIIGDVNHSSVMVAPDTTVRLIDCDSFQMEVEGNFFPCEAAEPLHRAPELFGMRPKDIVHTSNHDNFGLAVLIFELLFMGRHPFSGSLLTGSDLSLEEKIHRYLFAYGSCAEELGIRQPPNTLRLDQTSVHLAPLFELAFSTAALRPSPSDWIEGLKALQSTLIECSKNPAHYFANSLKACPWCEIEGRTGGILFRLRTTKARIKFELESAWELIQSVVPPKNVKSPFLYSLEEAAPARNLKVFGQFRRSLFFGLIVALSVSFIAWQLKLIDKWFFVKIADSMPVIFLSFQLINVNIKSKVKKRLRDSNLRLRNLENQWKTTATALGFKRKFQDLIKAKEEFETTSAYELAEYARLEQEAPIRQLHWYLDKIQIERGMIPGIGDARITILRSFGIESAADIGSMTRSTVPGVGRELLGRLQVWRDNCSAEFVFDPLKGVDPRDQARLDIELTQRFESLESELSSGAAALESICRTILAAQESLPEQIVNQRKILSQATADLGAL